MLRIVLPFLLFFSLNAAANIKVVTSIKPIHSIVSIITQGVSEVDLLLDSQQSAHHFHLKPSQISLLNKADLVIAINPNMEEGISKIITSLPKHKTLYVVEDEHDSMVNYHVWLDISKTQEFAQRLTNKLITINPENTIIFNNNFKALDNSLSKLDADIKGQLNHYNKIPIATYSNALAPFLSNNQLKSVVSVVNNHEQRLSAKRVLDARKAIKNNSVKCLLSTSEIASKRIYTIVENHNINSKSIDIMGYTLDKGVSHYFNLMQNITDKVEQCLQ